MVNLLPPSIQHAKPTGDIDIVAVDDVVLSDVFELVGLRIAVHHFRV